METNMRVRELIAMNHKVRHAMRSEDVERADGLKILTEIKHELEEILSSVRSVVITRADGEEVELDVLYWEDGYVVLMDDTIITPRRVLKGNIKLKTW